MQTNKDKKIMQPNRWARTTNAEGLNKEESDTLLIKLLNGENIMQVQQMTEVHKNTPLKKLPKLSEFLRKVWMTICFR